MHVIRYILRALTSVNTKVPPFNFEQKIETLEPLIPRINGLPFRKRDRERRSRKDFQASWN